MICAARGDRAPERLDHAGQNGEAGLDVRLYRRCEDRAQSI